MSYPISRRRVLSMMTAAAVLPLNTKLTAAVERDFRIRTITAGVKMSAIDDFASLQKAADFLRSGREQFTGLDYTVQTLRLATQPLSAYLPDWQSSRSLDQIKALDAFAREQKMMLNLGPLNNPAEDSEEFAAWVVEVITATENTNASLIVASADQPMRAQSTDKAAQIISGIAAATKGGEGNFRFAAAAYCPPGTPFFPAAWFENEAFSMGLESANLLQSSFSASHGKLEAVRNLKARMESELAPLQKQALKLSGSTQRAYLGIDTSPAPNLDVSIGRAIETLSGVPFGSPSTLAACAAITDVLKSLSIQSCGYSGLMLPILEDTTLAKRAREGRYSVSDLLLFSSVCGTGLDVVPLPGDTSVEQLSGVISDVAALATKYKKALSARLFPVPGKKVGETVSFDNPYLTDAMVMSID